MCLVASSPYFRQTVLCSPFRKQASICNIRTYVELEVEVRLRSNPLCTPPHSPFLHSRFSGFYIPILIHGSADMFFEQNAEIVWVRDAYLLPNLISFHIRLF